MMRTALVLMVLSLLLPMASSAQARPVEFAGLAVSEPTNTATESMGTGTKTIYLPLVTSAGPAPQSAIANIAFDPPSPATLLVREAVNVRFDYSTAYSGRFHTKVTVCYEDPHGCSSMPFGPLDGPTSGTQTVGFGFCHLEQSVTIGTVELRLITEDQSTVLVEVIVPVAYTFVP